MSYSKPTKAQRERAFYIVGRLARYFGGGKAGKEKQKAHLEAEIAEDVRTWLKGTYSAAELRRVCAHNLLAWDAIEAAPPAAQKRKKSTKRKRSR